MKYKNSKPLLTKKFIDIEVFEQKSANAKELSKYTINLKTGPFLEDEVNATPKALRELANIIKPVKDDFPGKHLDAIFKALNIHASANKSTNKNA
ncbi:MAG: hypothetical protein VKJ06_04010 [Vampirovibrionales bacterium]|nr:hypothetical protein [Vampirovibrionales bacterium]